MRPQDHKINQRPAPQPRRKPVSEIMDENWPGHPAPYELADASAIKALQQGTATAEQQRRALDWILKQACGLSRWPYRAGVNDRDTNIALGRQFVGHQIMMLVTLSMSSAPRGANSDAHEPQS